VDKPAEKEDLR